MTTCSTRKIRIALVAIVTLSGAGRVIAGEPPTAAPSPAPETQAPPPATIVGETPAPGEHGGEPASGEAHAPAHHRYIGAVGLFGTTFGSTYSDHDLTTGAVSTKLKLLYGGGGFVKVYVDKKSYWAIELAARAMENSKDDSIYVPVDLLVQRVFKVASFFKPFIGLGPSFVPVLKTDKLTGKGKTAFEAGGALDLGAYWPLGKSGVSILTILHYNLLWDVTNFDAEEDAQRIVHEFGLSLGVAYTF